MPSDLDPSLAETVNRLQALYRPPAPDAAFVAILEEELMAMPHSAAPFPQPLLGTGTTIVANGRVPMRQPRAPELPSGFALAHLASAALVVAVLAAAFVAFGPRMAQQSQQPATLPAIVAPATPDVGAVIAETLLDGVTDELAAGHAVIAVERLRWQPGQERTFHHGQYLPVIQPGTRMTFRNVNDRPLVLYRLTLTPENAAAAAAEKLLGAG